MEYLTFAKKIALQAGETMLKYFDSDMEKKYKDEKQIVTIADEEINKMVIEEVAKVYPDHSVFGEEASANKDSEMVWVCDPIDGTLPYSFGIPIAVFSLALVQDGKPMVGVVYDPFTKRLYSAQLEKGAYLNDKKLQVNTRDFELGSVANAEWWDGAGYEIEVPFKQIALDTKTYVVKLSSIIQACCMVARGSYVASVFGGTTGKSVDIAAIKVIVEEAGGKVTDLFGNEQRYDGDIKGAIVSNGVVHDEIVKRLNDYINS